jgi:TonB family protein
MAPLPPLTPTPPEPGGARVRPRTCSEISDETIWQSDAALIFVKLRKMIASDTQSTETILGTIAVAAHALTGGTGAAVAMPRDGVVVCVGRSGETAPELGDRLNVESGISGECLRTGVIMRCDDASRDFHVDAEVCRQLGLQSIAVVPLRGQFGRVGVLEAFSTESYAFNEEKMETLGRLAGLAEAAWARGAVTEARVSLDNQATTEIAALVESPAEPAVVAAHPAAIAPAVPLDQIREVLTTRETPVGHKKWRLAAIAAMALLTVGLLSAYGWREWYKASLTSQTTKSANGEQSSPADGENGNTGTAAGLTPDVTNPAARAASRPSPAIRASKSTAFASIPNEIAHRKPEAAHSTDSDTNANSLPSSAATAEEPPAIEASSANPADLGNALATSPALPRLGTPVSQGISGGVLVRRVQPVYPAEARRMHVEGSVVINAVVTAEGKVDQLELVSGDARLTPAAIEAVRQWRYTPYSLNGKPISKQTRITISFIAPQ